jgi:tellurite resistance protein TehA-like permease
MLSELLKIFLKGFIFILFFLNIIIIFLKELLFHQKEKKKYKSNLI